MRYSMSGGREIKFRLWNPSAKRFDYWGFLDGDNSFTGLTTGHSMTIAYGRENSEQFTGLKDKNGKEIYEGDILIDRAFGTRTLVCFGPYDNGWEYEDNRSGNGWYCKDKQGEISPLYEECDDEVVGNLHETPEILQ